MRIMGHKFRLSRSFYGSSKNLPSTPDFSQPTLVADGNNDEAYQTPYDAELKRQEEEYNQSQLDSLTDKSPKESFLNSNTPPHSPLRGVSFDLNGDNESVVIKREAIDEHTPLPSPKKNAFPKQHRRNQLLLSLSHTFSDVPDYQLGEYSGGKSNPSYRVKIVVVGDGGCGKTCLLVSYSQGEFPTVYVPTIFENYVAHVSAPNNEVVELALWDTAGQEDYDRLRPLSYPDADFFLICYSLDSSVSLRNVKQQWVPEVQYFCPGVPYFLVGLKSDLHGEYSSNSKVDRNEAKQVAKEIGALAHIECSAKTQYNVKTVFNLALDLTLKRLNGNKKDAVVQRLAKQLKGAFSPKKQPVPPTYEYQDSAIDLKPIKEIPKLAAGGATETTEKPAKKGKEKRKKHKCVIL